MDNRMQQRLLGQKGIDSQSINRSMDNRKPTPLSDMYFSQVNMNRIMKGLIAAVHQRTGLTIGPQSYSELLKIMRNIYNRFWHDDYQDIPRQLLELNRITVKEAVRWTMPDLLMHQKFQSEVLRNPVNVLPLPRNMSQAGNKLNGQGIADAFGL
jgi:hypothetical protein